MRERCGQYRQLIRGLRQCQKVLGIPEEPDAVVKVPGTGVLLPVYPNDQIGTEEGKFEKCLFNLYSMIGYIPPHDQS